MKSFELKRFNLKHNAQFTLRSSKRLSEAMVARALVHQSIAMAQEKAEQAYGFKSEIVPTNSFIEKVGQIATQSLLVSLMIMTPVAEAHAAAKPAKKKRKVVEYVFESKPATENKSSPAPAKVQKTRLDSSETKIVRTLKPVNGYENSADDQALADDLEEAPVRTIASVVPRKKRPIRADAGITADVLEEEKTEVPAFPMSRPTPKINSSTNLEETDINLVEEYY